MAELAPAKQRPDRVVVAEVKRPRGNRGELLALSLTDVPGRLENLRQASLLLSDGSDIAVEIQESWPYKEFWVLKFAGVDSIDDAERLSNSDLWIPASERGDLPEGSYFQSDLIGCSLIDHASGQKIGVVGNWQQYGGPGLLEAEIGNREVLIPFVPEICRKVDVAAKSISVSLPDGLLDL